MSTRRNDRLVVRLKDLCDSRKVTPYRVAAEIECKASTLHDIISGRRGVSDDLMVRLTDYFECDIADLLQVLPPSASSSSGP